MILHHIAVLSSDRNKTVNFYETLGFSVETEYKRENDVKIVMKNDLITLEIFVKDNCPKRLSYPEAYGLRHMCFKTDNIEEIKKQLKENGYFPEPIRNDTATDERLMFVADPDGLPIEIHE